MVCMCVRYTPYLEVHEIFLFVPYPEKSTVSSAARFDFSEYILLQNFCIFILVTNSMLVSAY